MKLNTVTIDAAGNIGIQWVKSDGGFHRTLIECDGDIDAQLSAVNAHMAQMGMTPSTDAEHLKALSAVMWTPSLVSAARELKAEAARKSEAEKAERARQEAEAKAEAERKAQQEQERFNAAVAAAVAKLKA